MVNNYEFSLFFKDYLIKVIRRTVDFNQLPQVLKGEDLSDEANQHVDKIRISGCGNVSVNTPINVHFYKLNPFVHGIDSAIEISEEVNAAHAHLLPCTELEGLWESLFYDTNIKDEALRYVGNFKTVLYATLYLITIPYDMYYRNGHDCFRMPSGPYAGWPEPFSAFLRPARHWKNFIVQSSRAKSFHPNGC